MLRDVVIAVPRGFATKELVAMYYTVGATRGIAKGHLSQVAKRLYQINPAKTKDEGLNSKRITHACVRIWYTMYMSQRELAYAPDDIMQRVYSEVVGLFRKVWTILRTRNSPE